MKNNDKRKEAHQVIATLIKQKKNDCPNVYDSWEKDKEETCDMIISYVTAGMTTGYEEAITSIENSVKTF